MPIPYTKYNYNTVLKNDLSQNYIIACHDPSNAVPNIYLTNKASYLIHPFSKVSNCVTKFDTSNNKLFQYKAPARVPINNATSLTEIPTQKIIQNQVRTKSSLYTNTLGSLYINSNNLHTNNKSWHNASDRKEKHKNGVDIKHNSYARYLGKKKSQYLKTEPESTPQIIPSMGNKTRKFGLINCEKTC